VLRGPDSLLVFFGDNYVCMLVALKGCLSSACTYVLLRAYVRAYVCVCVAVIEAG